MTIRKGYWPENYWAVGYWAEDFWPERYIPLIEINQMGDVVWISTLVMDEGEPAVDDVFENLDISSCVPSTAKSVFGFFGLTSTSAAARGMGVSSNTSGSNNQRATIGLGDLVGDYKPKGAVYFMLPLLTPQQISWKGSPKTVGYGIKILGFIDNL